MDDTRHISQRGQHRLTGFDYAQGRWYYVTVCVEGRREILSEIRDLTVVLRPSGGIVQQHWNELPQRYPVQLDAFVIMPDHVHGILMIDDLKNLPTARPTLSFVLRGFKTYSAMDINRMLGTQGKPLWQRNYYDHIIRNDTDLFRAREYIGNNPVCWDLKNRTEPGYIT